MKTLAKSVKILLATGIFMLSAISCSGNENDKAKEDSLAAAKKHPATEKIADKGFAPSSNIRYVDDTLLMQKYDFARITLEECQKIALELQNYQNSLARQLSERQAAIQQKIQTNSYLSEASYKADMTELQKFDQSCQAQYAKRAQSDNDKIEKKTLALRNAIDNFIARYNQTHTYDAILYKSAGLYFNPQLDITEEIATLMNNEYKAAKEPAKK